MSIQDVTQAAVNRVAKWRVVFAGWQLGTRQKGDPECDAVREHREATIMLRVEASALTRLLLEKKVFTLDEYQVALTDEANALSDTLSKSFPGFRAVDDGIVMTPEAAETTKGWKP